MPNRNGRGPLGEGPLTGGGRGRCAAPVNRQEMDQRSENIENIEFERGRGIGFAMGRGFGPGQGRRPGAGQGRGFGGGRGFSAGRGRGGQR